MADQIPLVKKRPRGDSDGKQKFKRVCICAYFVVERIGHLAMSVEATVLAIRRQDACFDGLA